MNLKKIKKELIDFLESNSNPLATGETNEITHCINIIVKDIELLQKEDDVDLSRITESDTIQKCILDLGEVVLDSPINDNFCSFISSFSELVFNWNNNTRRDTTIKIVSLYINRLAESYTILKNSSVIIKNTVDTIRTLKNWMPPAFDVSEKYFDEMLNVLEKSKPNIASK